MSAKIKSAIKKSTYKTGLRIFTKFLVNPTLKLGSAAVKDIVSPRKSSFSPNYNTISFDKAIPYTREESNKIDSQQRKHLREIGLDQCEITRSILKRLFDEPEINSEIKNTLLKSFVVSGNYIDKGDSCGVDFFNYAHDFISNHILTLKTEKAR